MAAKNRLRITVYRKFECTELPDFKHGCQTFKVGTEYIVKENGLMPEGFCPWAWNALFPVALTLRYDGHLPMCQSNSGMMYSSCPDGLHPVVFKVERIPGEA